VVYADRIRNRWDGLPANRREVVVAGA
jgi:hypothetical protein